MIYVEGLTKSFKVTKRQSGMKETVKSFFKPVNEKITAVKDLSFHIAPGEIVGYIGPNGAGKSTTIKMMCGILVPDSGDCRIDGKNPWKARVEHVKNIGAVFGQRSQLWWDIPVVESFQMLKYIYKIDEKLYKSQLELLISSLDLKNILTTPVRQLSLGQRMRCEVAASLLHDPKILFLDEPTIGLDAVSKLAVRHFIKKINKEKNTTIILTTHDMSDIDALANRMMLIGKGQLLLDGDISDLKKTYFKTKKIIVDHSDHYKKIDMPGITHEIENKNRSIFYVPIKEKNVSEVIQNIASNFDVIDLEVTNPDVESLVIDLYRKYHI
jgi:ABC-2 type transport system ATP-binding protein